MRAMRMIPPLTVGGEDRWGGDAVRRTAGCKTESPSHDWALPYAMAMLLAACGPGNVAQDDDAQGDDDAFMDDDATVGDDDAATGGTGTISVTVEVLAVLQEGQSVEAEIVLDGTPTGVFAPVVDPEIEDRRAEIEADSGNHTVTLKTNEPDAPVAQRFVAAPHEVSVARDASVACPMFLGRDLRGIWRTVEFGGGIWSDDPFEVQTYFTDPPGAEPCPTGIWTGGWEGPQGGLCLLAEDRVWFQFTDPNPDYTTIGEGNLLDDGTRVEYDFTAAPDGGPPPGPFAFEREE